MAMVLKTSPMLASEKPIGPSNQYSIFSILKKISPLKLRLVNIFVTLARIIKAITEARKYENKRTA